MPPSTFCARESIPWQRLSPVELEREYSPSSAIGGNYQPYLEHYALRSAAARAWFAGQTAARVHYDIAYGTAASQRFDVFLPAPNLNISLAAPPLLVFIHGGYWQALSKNDSHFAARAAVQLGFAHAVLDYTLAPAASVADIVGECARAVQYLHTHAKALGYDPSNIIVAGSSAGAHLAAMVALRNRYVRGAVLVSGIYELEPLIHTSINQALGMNAADAHASSPQRQDLSTFPASVLAFGAVETAQFKQQSAAFAAALPHCVGCVEIPERNHFDIVFDLLNPATALGQQAIKLIQRV